jgi:hypothetical protein
MRRKNPTFLTYDAFFRKPGATGHEARNHYHEYNPNTMGKHDQYLDVRGKPCSRGSNESHLYPGE